MRAIHLMAVSASTGAELQPPIGLLDELAASLASVFRVSCHVSTDVLDVTFALEPGRRQYHSTAILRAMVPLAQNPDIRLLGVTGLDLFVPVLTFVFGEAQLGGRCGLVSLHRLREEYYGLPENPPLTAARLVKEAVHELGHTLGLRHCPDWQCAMASTHSVERLDVKEGRYCESCSAAIGDVFP